MYGIAEELRQLAEASRQDKAAADFAAQIFGCIPLEVQQAWQQMMRETTQAIATAVRVAAESADARAYWQRVAAETQQGIALAVAARVDSQRAMQAASALVADVMQQDAALRRELLLSLDWLRADAGPTL